jgi:hypothetical protein
MGCERTRVSASPQLVRLAFVCGAFSAICQAGLDDDLDVHAADRFGMTAIGWACAFGHVGCLRYAIDTGISLEHTNIFCWNYADLAAANKRPDIVRELARLRVASPGATMADEMRRLGIPLVEAMQK